MHSALRRSANVSSRPKHEAACASCVIGPRRAIPLRCPFLVLGNSVKGILSEIDRWRNPSPRIGGGERPTYIDQEVPKIVRVAAVAPKALVQQRPFIAEFALNRLF